MCLQEAYRAELGEVYGITFNSLLCLNNMPIKRYVDYLQRRGLLADYMQLLVESFNVGAAEGVMCRGTVSVGWDGRLYDCDFNQQLELGLRWQTPRCPVWLACKCIPSAQGQRAAMRLWYIPEWMCT
jgi:hypothetical protein